MNATYNLLDVVALLTPYKKMCQGAIGTIVEKLDKQTYLVEFCDDRGRMVALESLNEGKLLKLQCRQSLALHA